ncbi:MAG TPA: hypothetical protein VNN72_00765 [Polyangiaceae bacterium]|nr:hypothetical protein [Polyangiaceae bacterium]
MNDLRRWSEEDATADELRLLEVARRRRALPAQRAAVLSALGVGVATTAAGAAGTASLATKLVGIALLASVGTGVVLVHSASEKAAVAPPAASVATPPKVAVTASPEPSAAPPEPALALEPASEASEPSAKLAAKPKAAPSASSSLSRELQVLKQAHEAIARGNPNGALAALDDYHARFPQGALGAEETVIRVQALLARGDRAQAAAVAKKFSAAHPDSLYARRVERLVSGVE